MNATDDTGFGVEHLPYGVVSRFGAEPRPAVRIGDQALELAPLAAAGLLDEVAVEHEALSRALDAPNAQPPARAGTDRLVVTPRPAGEPARRYGRWARGYGACRPRAGIAGQGRNRAPDRGRRLRRLLFLARARLQRRRPDPPRRRSALSELAPPACRLPRARRVGGPERNPGSPAAGTEPAGRARRAAGFRPRATAGFRARARLRHRTRPGPRGAGDPRAGGEPRVRIRPRQRLERPLDAGLGVPAARSLPEQVLRDLARDLDHAARGARALPRRGPTRSPSRPPTCAATSPGRSTWTWRWRWSRPDQATSR